MPLSGRSGTPGESRRWRSAWQFALAIFAILALSFAVDPLVESFRKRSLESGWQRFRPPHETSTLLREGARLWSGGRDGLAVFDWSKAELRAAPEGTPSLERVRALALDRKGDLWAAHSGGVERRVQGQWMRLDSAVGPAAAVLERRNGEIWVGGEKGLARWRGDHFEIVRDLSALGFEGVDALLEDRAGNLWVASAHPLRGGAGLLTATGVWQDFTHAAGLAHPTVNSFFEDREGGVWFATGFGRQGAACRLLDGAWTRLTKADGLASDRTRLIFEDRRGHLWVSSEVDGTAVRVEGRWHVLTPREGMTGWEVKCALETPDGALWLATEDGVTRMDASAAILHGGTAR